MNLCYDRVVFFREGYCFFWVEKWFRKCVLKIGLFYFVLVNLFWFDRIFFKSVVEKIKRNLYWLYGMCKFLILRLV